MGLIGNCAYMSYIDKSGEVSWQCWPNFDSSFVFGSMIAGDKGGEFSIRPERAYTSHQSYLTNTNILVTHFKAEDGEFRVVDFAPRFGLFERYHKPLMLFRKIEMVKGTPLVKVICEPAGEYGHANVKPVVGSNSINFTGLPSKLRLTTNIAKSKILEKKPFVLSKDYHLVLSWGSPLEAPLERTFEEFLGRTREYWQEWVKRCSIPSVYQEEVIRSALVLKLHQFEDTGAFIASGTTSLPEHPGSGRNWDYRYCWIRDSYFTLNALHSLGHFSEVEDYSHWIQNIVQERPGVFQPVYRIDGSADITESIVDLPGYKGNQPVRIGNAAYTQIQHDVYGQMLLSMLPLYVDKRMASRKAVPSLELLHTILDKIKTVMDEPDAGIWEYREKMQRHAESYLFHWSGAHGAIKIAEQFGDAELLNKAKAIVKEASKNLEACYDKKLKAYGMAIENHDLNAAEFLLVTMGYIQDPLRAKEHVLALEKRLKTDDHLIYRYRDKDDFGETHSTFLICAFWYAEALAKVGRVEESQRVFESLLTRSNPLGLYSEDICPQDGSQWGNFVQTYSHVGLINTAFQIEASKNQPSFL